MPSIKIYEPSEPLIVVGKRVFVSIAPQGGDVLGAYAIAYPEHDPAPEPDVRLQRRAGTDMFQGLLEMPAGRFRVAFRADFAGATRNDPPQCIYKSPNDVYTPLERRPIHVAHDVEILDPVTVATVIENELFVEVEAKNGSVAEVFAITCIHTTPVGSEPDPTHTLTQVGATDFYNGNLPLPTTDFKVHVKVHFWADDPMDPFIVRFKTSGVIPRP